MGFDPEQIRATPDSRYVYLASTLGDALYKLDVDRAKVVATIPVKDPRGSSLPFPYNLTITPDGRTIYVANVFGNFIAVVDTRLDRVVRTWQAAAPVGMQLSPDQSKLYVTSFWNASVDEYSVSTGRLLRTSGKTDISLPSFDAESADGRYLYFGQSFGTRFMVFDITAWKPVTTLTVGAGPNSVAIRNSASPR